METFTQKNFNLGELKGISKKSIEEHMKLYAGYVKNSNLVLEKIKELEVDQAKNAYLLSELHRRFAFEFGGMRNHEYYFSSFENGATQITEDGALINKIIKEFGSFENWLTAFQNLAMTRGVGWAMLSYDRETDKLFNHFVDEQHMGHLVSTTPILALDMWEHAYFLDYTPAEKKNYILAFFENLNWKIIENNFKKTN